MSGIARSSTPISVAEPSQTLLVHCPLRQSSPPAHIWPSSHLRQVGRPQSVSVSIPSFLPFIHSEAMQTLLVQTRLSQSPAVMHVLPAAQPGQRPPPQSVSVSSPFFFPSPHDGASHF